MSKYNFITAWQALTIILFTLISIHLILLGREVVYVGYYPKDSYSYQSVFELDLCYRTYIESDQCELDSSATKLDKLEFNCSLELPIGCYTAGFRQKKVSEIIAKFNECHILDWVSVKPKTQEVEKIGKELWLFDGFICAKHKFLINNKKEKTLYLIQQNLVGHPEAALQPFDGYITYSRAFNKSNEKYGTKKTHLFKRNCWKIDSETSKCTETGKKLIFETEYHSAHHLEAPFTTNCVERNEPNESSQNDCYENCVKEKRKFHLLTYGPNDDFILDYNRTSDSEMARLLDKCAARCHQEDCQSMGFFTEDIHEGNMHVNNQLDQLESSAFIINLGVLAFGSKAIPLFGLAKLLWMLLAFFSIFFGVNFYGLLMKAANQPNFFNFPVVRRKKQRKKYRKPFMIAATITILSIGASLALEKALFGFGIEKSQVFLRKESIEERSVSLSICFDLCKIIKDEFRFKNESLSRDNCGNEVLIERTLRELDSITWNVGDFKSQASMRTNARVYPIRQAEFRVWYFFRDFKKCFLLFYEAKNLWPHFSLQRYSRIHINITDRSYAYFFVTDGLSFPDYDAVPTRRSVLHSLVMNEEKADCTDYATLGRPALTTRDNYIQDCIIEEAKKNLSDNRILPMDVNLPISVNSNLSAYEFYDLKFFNDSQFATNSLERCEEEYPRWFKFGMGCTFVIHKLTHKEIFEERDHITVNLTPLLYELTLLEDESTLVVFNRILTFVLIFTGFSVKQVLEPLISIHFFTALSHFNFQFARRLLQFVIFLFFFAHFCSLFTRIINHPMLETASYHFLDELRPYRIRFCYHTKANLDSYSYNLEKLEKETFNFTHIFHSISIYDDKEIAAKLTAEDYDCDENKDCVYTGCHKFLQLSPSKDIDSMYADDLKCFNFELPFGQTAHDLNLNFQRLISINKIQFDLTKLKEEKNISRVFIFLNRYYSYDFDWDRKYETGNDYMYGLSIVRSNYQDDFWCDHSWIILFNLNRNSKIETYNLSISLQVHKKCVVLSEGLGRNIGFARRHLLLLEKPTNDVQSRTVCYHNFDTSSAEGRPTFTD